MQWAHLGHGWCVAATKLEKLIPATCKNNSHTLVSLQLAYLMYLLIIWCFRFISDPLSCTASAEASPSDEAEAFAECNDVQASATPLHPQCTKTFAVPKKPSRRPKRTRIDSELHRVDSLLNDSGEDEPCHFGRVVAEWLRDCPKHTWADAQIDILTVLRNYRTQHTDTHWTLLCLTSLFLTVKPHALQQRHFLQ